MQSRVANVALAISLAALFMCHRNANARPSKELPSDVRMVVNCRGNSCTIWRPLTRRAAKSLYNSRYRNAMFVVERLNQLPSLRLVPWLRNLSIFVRDLRSDQPLKNFAPIAALKKLQRLIILHPVTTLEPLKKLISLRHLLLMRLSKQAAKELVVVSKLKNLVSLQLNSSASVTDLRWLQNHPSLQKLILHGIETGDFRVLGSLPKLTSLTVGMVPNEDWRGVGRATSLRTLRIFTQKLTTLRPFRGLKKLRKLTVHGPSLKNIDDVKSMTQLREINLNHTDIQSVDALGKLQSLRTIELVDTRVRDISPLTRIKALKVVTIQNSFPSANLRAFRKARGGVKVVRMPRIGRVSPLPPAGHKPSPYTTPSAEGPPRPPRNLRRP